MSKSSIGLYPGSFDPITNGHLDIIERARRLFDKVIVAVSINVDKHPLFTLEERIRMIEVATARWEDVEVDHFGGLLVDYAVRREAQAIIRGIRAITDFDYEFQMALMNRRLRNTLETVFLVPAEAYTYLSSSLVKEVAGLGGSVAGLVPEDVEALLLKRLSSGSVPTQSGGGSR